MQLFVLESLKGLRNTCLMEGINAKNVLSRLLVASHYQLEELEEHKRDVLD